MNKSSICKIAIGGILMVSGAIAKAEDRRICSQPFGYDSVTQTYQVIKVSCENLESILQMNPGYKYSPTRKNKKTGEQSTQINDKYGNPIFGIYVPPRKQTQNPNS